MHSEIVIHLTFNVRVWLLLNNHFFYLVLNFVTTVMHIISATDFPLFCSNSA